MEGKRVEAEVKDVSQRSRVGGETMKREGRTKQGRGRWVVEEEG